jgi:hypothetical protein
MAYAMGLPALIACSASQVGRGWSTDAPPDGSLGADSSSGSGGGSSSGNAPGSFGPFDSSAPAPASNSACKAGHYAGTFNGSYSSHLILGIPLKVSGNVDMTLDQAGDAGTNCMFVGEFQMCSNFFLISGGTVTGVANQTDDSGTGGYPYFCALTGTLDCPNKKIIGGWIQCTYCIGQLAPGGMACAPSLGGLGPAIGGHFAGPLTADYDTSTLSFANGTWNGAEALAGVDAGTATPSGPYGIGNYGGGGSWNATHQ